MATNTMSAFLVQILGILDGKVVIGHALYNDFQALDFNHPGHMIRDTSGMRLLRRLAGFPTKRCVSLKILANSLLNRKIQVSAPLCHLEPEMARCVLVTMFLKASEVRDLNRSMDILIVFDCVGLVIGV